MWHLFNFLLTTLYHVDNQSLACNELLLLPQRYVFSSKSQLMWLRSVHVSSCCCYHKGTYFQANHNPYAFNPATSEVVVATTKVRIFKQITTVNQFSRNWICCCCYHKGTYFQANHNSVGAVPFLKTVVVATTKVRIFKQITTDVLIFIR